MAFKLNKVHKVSILGLSTLLFGFLLASTIIPAVVRLQVKRKTSLKNGWFRRDIVWNKFPFVIDFHFYMFNVTNPEEIKNGEKPILQQVGPFVYDEYHEKTNQVDHEEDDTVEFTIRNTLFFNAEKSNGLTGEEEIIVPHYFILGVLNTLMRVKPTAIPIFGKAMDSIFKKPTNIFIKAKVKDLLFEGLEIDCSVKDFAGSAICSEIKPTYADLGMKKIDEDKYLMSLWGSRNGTDSKGIMRVLRGIKEVMDVGKVIEYDHKSNISTWDDEYCDTFAGTDGTVFHPYFDKKGTDLLISFNPDLCRNIYLHFESRSRYAGLHLLRYTTNLGTDPEGDPRDKCFCPAPDKCLKKGVYDVTKCINMPLIISNPHFYLADPYYRSFVEGMNPVKEDHMIIVDLDAFTGSPIHARSRAQFNMNMFKVEKYKVMKNFPDAVLPLLWIDEKIIIADFLIKEIKNGYVLMKLGVAFEFIVFIAGLAICVYAIYLQYKVLNGEGENTEKPPIKNGSTKSNGSQKKLPINTVTSAQVPAAVG